MYQINERDDAPLSICAETQGRFELDPESTEPNENCAFSRLIQAGYNCSSLASSDERGALSIGFLYRAVYPEKDTSTAINKMQPDCLELFAITRKCKFKIAPNTASDFINKDGKNAPGASFYPYGNRRFRTSLP